MQRQRPDRFRHQALCRLGVAAQLPAELKPAGVFDDAAVHQPYALAADRSHFDCDILPPALGSSGLAWGDEAARQTL
jgi:hypothetical protein